MIQTEKRRTKKKQRRKNRLLVTKMAQKIRGEKEMLGKTILKIVCQNTGTMSMLHLCFIPTCFLFTTPYIDLKTKAKNPPIMLNYA